MEELEAVSVGVIVQNLCAHARPSLCEDKDQIERLERIHKAYQDRNENDGTEERLYHKPQGLPA